MPLIEVDDYELIIKALDFYLNYGPTHRAERLVYEDLHSKYCKAKGDLAAAPDIIEQANLPDCEHYLVPRFHSDGELAAYQCTKCKKVFG